METEETLSLRPIDRLDILKISLDHYNNSLRDIDTIARLKDTEGFLNDIESKLAQDEEKPDHLDIEDIVCLEAMCDAAITGYWAERLTSHYRQQAGSDLPKGE